MSSNSSIEWTETTWNPVTGCTEASTGCANCYARGMSKRLAAMARADEAKGKNPGKKAAYKLSVLDDGRWSGVVTPVPSVLSEPLSWKKPRRVFVNSMSDLFWGTDADLKVARQRGVKDPRPVPFEFIDQVFAVMALCPQHTFQILTKRPERMAEYLNGRPFDEDGWGVGRGQLGVEETIAEFEEGCCDWLNDLPVWSESGGLLPLANQGGKIDWPLPNVWLGTSVENQATADERIPHLLNCPASVRWLSMEPLLGPVDITNWRKMPGAYCGYCGDPAEKPCDDEPGALCPWKPLTGIQWIVLGGESGHNARPFNIAWARSIIGQCREAGVPVFVKQLGTRPTGHCPDRGDGKRGPYIKGKKGGDPSEWPEDLRVREYPVLEGGAPHA